MSHSLLKDKDFPYIRGGLCKDQIDIENTEFSKQMSMARVGCQQIVVLYPENRDAWCVCVCVFKRIYIERDCKKGGGKGATDSIRPFQCWKFSNGIVIHLV